jgi:hypothetical protein
MWPVISRVNVCNKLLHLPPSKPKYRVFRSLVVFPQILIKSQLLITCCKKNSEIYSEVVSRFGDC